MATGTTADSDVTRTELITLAFKDIGVVEPSTDEMADGVTTLNMLVRHLDAKGDWLHAVDSTVSTLTTVASQQEYSTGVLSTTISANIHKLEYAAVYINTRDEPLVIFDRAESLRTTLKDETSGQPVACYLERARLRSDNKLLLYPTPNAAYTIRYNFRRPLYDFDLSTDNPDVPGAFLLPLKKLLGAELGISFGLSLNERQLLRQEGEMQFMQAVAGLADPPSYQPLASEYY